MVPILREPFSAKDKIDTIAKVKISTLKHIIGVDNKLISPKNMGRTPLADPQFLVHVMSYGQHNLDS